MPDEARAWSPNPSERQSLLDATDASQDSAASRLERFDRHDIIDWLLKSDEDVLLWILRRLTSHRSEPCARALAEASAQRSDNIVEVPHSGQPPRHTKEGFGRHLHSPIVQFSAAHTYCREEDSEARLTLMRLGDPEPRVEVCVKTKDCSAKAWMKYIPLEATVVFEPGQLEAEVIVDLIDDENWDPNLELTVRLQEEGLVNATLGRYLWQARVKIIDDDPFPTNRNKDKLVKQKCDEISPLVLFIEYMKMNYNNATVRWRTNMVLAIGQMENFCYLFELLAAVYLVDYVFDQDKRHQDLFAVHDRWLALVISSLTFVVPFGLVHYLHYIRQSTGHVGGNSRKTLQSALLRQYLNLEHAARTGLRSSDLVMGTTRDSHKMVMHGYKAAIRLSEAFGHLVTVITFQLISPLLFDRHTSALAFLPLLVVPAMMALFLQYRQQITSSALEGRFQQQDFFAEEIRQTVDNYQLINDFHQRPRAIEQFELRINQFNTKNRLANVVRLNNSYFVNWLEKITICIWTLIGGSRVLSGNLSLGMFLVNIRIFHGIGNSWKKIYKELLDIQTVFPVIKRLTRFLNMPTDVSLRAMLAAHNQQITSILMLKHHNMIGDVPIQMSNIDITFPRDSIRVTTLRGRGLLEVRQGELVCLVGPKGGGKSTVLKLLGGQILPSPTQVAKLVRLSQRGLQPGSMSFYVSSHLRVLAVSSEPTFIEGTLLDNLTYGVPSGDADGSKDRVLRICDEVGLGSMVKSLIQAGETAKWASVLSQTQKHLLCIARALVANPEVLCLHKPTLILDASHAENIHRVLAQFVLRAGIAQSHADATLRGPRTCIFTTTKALVPEEADQVYHISADEGIRRLGVKQVTTPRGHDAQGRDNLTQQLEESY